MMVHSGRSFILRNEKLRDGLEAEHRKDTWRTRSPDSCRSVARMESKPMSRNIRPHSKKLYLV